MPLHIACLRGRTAAAAAENYSMTLELDRNGVPVYAGTAEHFDEWKERALDLYHSRAGQDSLQASTALALRGGLRDIAYESARKIL